MIHCLPHSSVGRTNDREILERTSWMRLGCMHLLIYFSHCSSCHPVPSCGCAASTLSSRWKLLGNDYANSIMLTLLSRTWTFTGPTQRVVSSFWLFLVATTSTSALGGDRHGRCACPGPQVAGTMPVSTTQQAQRA